MNVAGLEAPEEFATALRSLRGVRLRPELALQEIPGPARSAPFSAALEADLLDGPDHEALADGRFVVLHDPAGRDAWSGTFRVVILVRTRMDAEMSVDPLLCEVAWTWLTESLEAHVDGAHELSGSVTRTVNQGFGALADRADEVELELRASWSPYSADLAPHLRAWAQTLSTAGGLGPLPDGVAVLRPYR